MEAKSCLGRTWNVGTLPRLYSSETHISRLDHPHVLVTKQYTQAEQAKCQQGVQSGECGPSDCLGQQKTHRKDYMHNT